MLTTPFRVKSESQVNTSDAPVASGRTSFQGNPQVVALPGRAVFGDAPIGGGYVVVWEDDSGTYNSNGKSIVGQVYDGAGNKLGGEARVSGPTSGSQFAPKVVYLPPDIPNEYASRIAVAYQENVSGNNNIYVARISPDLNPPGEPEVDWIEVGAAQAVNPSITAFATAGGPARYTVSYTLQNSATDSDIVGRYALTVPNRNVFDHIGPEFVIQSIDGPVDFSELATLSNGMFTAVYQVPSSTASMDHDLGFVYRLPDGSVPPGSLGNNFVAANGPAEQTDPHSAGLLGGFMAIVWTESSATVTDIRVSVFTNDALVSAGGVLVNSAQSGAQNEADVVALSDGGFLVTWEDDAANLMRGQRFDHWGQKIGIEFAWKIGVAGGGAEAALLKDGRVALVVADTSTGDTDVTTQVLDLRTVFSSGDFNGDGTTDLAWRNLDLNPAGQLWTLRDGKIQSTADFGGAATRLQSLGHADANGDGTDDILLRAPENGNVFVRFVQDGVAQPSAFLGGAGPQWQPLTATDINGDNTDDLLWRNELTGSLQAWIIRNGAVQSAATLGGASLQWQALDGGDFNRDGTEDLAWRNVNSGAVQIWLMENGAIRSTATIGAAGVQWQALGTGDFNGDGGDDFLWRNDITGVVHIWNMANGSVQTTADAGVAAPQWHSLGVGDFDGDGDGDAMWRDVDTGAVQDWLFENNAVQSGLFIGGASTAAWHLFA